MGVTSVLLAAAAIFPVPLPGTSQPAWSRDGTRLAYVEARGKPYAATRADIHIVIPSTRAPNWRLTRGGGYNSGPAWSPDGRRIAYVWTSRDRARGALMIVNADGRRRRVLVRGFVSRPTWSPDGTTLAYVSGGRLRALTIATREVRDVAEAPGTDPAWSPDGALLAFAGPCTISLFELTTGVTYPSEPLGCIPELTIGAPSWLDGGTRLVFSICELWRHCELAFAPRLRPIDVTTPGMYVGPDVAWSSDGYRMAWSCLIDGRVWLSARDRRRPGLAFGCP